MPSLVPVTIVEARDERQRVDRFERETEDGEPEA